jgi:hypothetical protein
VNIPAERIKERLTDGKHVASGEARRQSENYEFKGAENKGHHERGWVWSLLKINFCLVDLYTVRAIVLRIRW